MVIDMAGFDNLGTPMPGGSLGSPNGPVAVPGKVAGALYFDGTTHLEVTDHPEINFIGSCPGAESFTIDAWIKADPGGASTQTLLDKRVSSPNWLGYNFYLYNGRLGFQIADGTVFRNHNSNPSLPDLRDGAWHFIAVTVTRCSSSGFDGSFYVDGSLIDTFSDTWTGDLSNSADLWIGLNRDGTHPYGGCIDELEFFNRALTLTEVQSIFNAGSDGKDKCPPHTYTIPICVGYNLIANELDCDCDHDSSKNTLKIILPNVPIHSGLQKWCNNAWYSYEKKQKGWPDGSTLSPGEGAFLLNLDPKFNSLTFTGYRRAAIPIPHRVYGFYGCQDNDVPVERTFQDILGWPASADPLSQTKLFRWTCESANYTGNTYLRGSWSSGPPQIDMGEAVWISEPVTSLVNSPQDETEPPTPPPYLIGYDTSAGSDITLNLEWLSMIPAYLQQAADCAGAWTYVVDSQSGQPVTSPYTELVNRQQHSKFFRLTTIAPAK
jgi:hypothetical protein